MVLRARVTEVSGCAAGQGGRRHGIAGGVHTRAFDAPPSPEAGTRGAPLLSRKGRERVGVGRISPHAAQ